MGIVFAVGTSCFRVLCVLRIFSCRCDVVCGCLICVCVCLLVVFAGCFVVMVGLVFVNCLVVVERCECFM